MNTETPDAATHPDHHANITVRAIGETTDPVKLKVDADATLAEVLDLSLDALGKKLIPSPSEPLDKLHNIQHGEVGPEISDLSVTVGDYLREKGTSHDFAIELVRAFRVNTRWAVAPNAEMAPREILALFALDFQQYGLYLQGSSALLPIDTPVGIERGKVFEAQRDGRYGRG
jgi:hypothetical protein